MRDQTSPLRYGWTTGACAAAAAKAAFAALLGGEFPDPVVITLPRGEQPAFALARYERGEGYACATIVKDAGDDPDVTHGALVSSTVRPGEPGTGVTFRAGQGVGTVTRPGLPLPVGEPAINPGPRGMIAAAIAEVAAAHGVAGDVEVTVAIADGEAIARKTLNGRLGIVGGLSVLGTTGIVVPFSCSAWIHSIHRGIDVARGAGLDHVAGATGAASEEAVARLYGLPEIALIDMGDFVGGMLKYLRVHPVPRVTVAGGFAKITKLGQGLLDLHSRAGPVDMRWLAERVEELGGNGETAYRVSQANTAIEALEIAGEAGLDLPPLVARYALKTAKAVMRDAEISLDVAIFDRDGRLLAGAD
ncbi:cobalt-precorrin-5B (C(1))-methyltransferase [Labrys portucalensis]|uniref:Cobalt-precorrin-5B C(1)-methyltransferase n=1 Tax=Labrys neptuniae TaxID=376174 RepID=A0ABV6ZNP9_9HYPH